LNGVRQASKARVIIYPPGDAHLLAESGLLVEVTRNNINTC
jgi:hypothetical protein